MVEEFYKKHMLLTGTDSGNTSNKISFLNEEGNVDSFVISTVIAPAPSSVVKMKGDSSKEKDIPVENKLHVHINSSALPDSETKSYWYVGEFAKDKENREEPKRDNEGKTEEKFNNKIHIITTLTGLAVAAIKANKREVKVDYSGGLPINEYKDHGQKVLSNLLGEHVITFVDGPYEGETVQIKIEDGEVQIEGVTTSLALSYDIENGDIVETELGKVIGEEFTLGDLGAGTTDLAVFDENGINTNLSSNTNIGTNTYVDRIMQKILEVKEFSSLRDRVGQEARPYRTREEFMKKVIEPAVFKMIDNSEDKPKFKASWLMKKDVDITDIVIEEMVNYANDQLPSLYNFWGKSNTEKFVLVGGGLLFGYIRFREEKDFILPPKLVESQFMTSRSYLIANYLKQLEKKMINEAQAVK